jgi:hypothetical protein
VLLTIRNSQFAIRNYCICNFIYERKINYESFRNYESARSRAYLR